ncbi:MAG: putative Ig domain-containing protein [Acidobacteriia bacterium]|nr:putative Ig domain-containing protein [Terriglobia bacterium]
MSGAGNDRFHGTLHSSWLPDRVAAPQLGAMLMVLLAAFITAGCGTSAQAGSNSHSLTLTGTPPAGTANQSYNTVLTVSGGSAPYHFGIKSGTLPQGLTLNPATGSISGTPVSAGSYPFEVIVTDAPLPDQGTETFVVTVGAGDPVKLSVSPTSLTIAAEQKQQFTAAVSGTANTAVTWSATTGSISSSGLYTAPVVNVQTSATIKATSVADSSKSASATVTVTASTGQSLTITNGNPPDGRLNSAYAFTFTAAGGTQPYTWSVSAGSLPKGLTLGQAGELSGTPAATGSFGFKVTVKDKAAHAVQGSFGMNLAGAGNFDGPAELPRVDVPSTMADTPAPGSRVQVAASGDLQAAINNAQCGDTIELQAGATYDKLLTLPAKPCDDQHWIIIRTNAPDSALPAEGQRLTPCYAGLASLPNRPAYNCPKSQNVLAKISHSVHMGSGPILLASGANHYRLVGLEITRFVDKVPVVALVSTVKDSPADHIVIDRSWLHGTAQDETRRGVALRGTTYVAIVDSYLNDFHCTAISGTCTDASATGGGTGDLASGPWKIEGNFLEAAGENILFGGAAATIVPADITIRHNHFYKVPQWRKGEPGFVGGYSGDPFVVKNLFEIKNGTRILFEGNILEYSWGGFSQFGQAILITPRNAANPDTKEGNLCPMCEATDITIRYNKISHTAAGFNIANVMVGNLGAQAGERYSIHDIVVDDIDAAKYKGGGGLFLVMNNWPKQTLNNVSIRHVTGFPDQVGHLMAVMNDLSYPQMYAFTFSDNLVVVPTHPVWSAGGTNNCAVADVPTTVLSTCFKTYTFTNNVLAAVTKAFPPAKWPGGNFFPSTVDEVGFVNYNNGSGGDYHLQASSPHKGKASDGKDPGADIDAVNAATQGVE